MAEDNRGRKSLKIGIGAPLTGMGIVVGREMTQAIQLAIDDSVGYVDGFRLTACILDDRGDEEHGLRIARSFAQDEEVVAIVGHYNSNVTLRVAPLLRRGGDRACVADRLQPDADRIRVDERVQIHKP